MIARKNAEHIAVFCVMGTFAGGMLAATSLAGWILGGFSIVGLGILFAHFQHAEVETGVTFEKPLTAQDVQATIAHLDDPGVVIYFASEHGFMLTQELYVARLDGRRALVFSQATEARQDGSN